MRDQQPALRYLAEKQFERIEREQQFWILVAAVAAPALVAAVVIVATIVA